VKPGGAHSNGHTSILKNWHTKTDSSNLLRIAVAWTQLHLGTKTCFLQEDTKTILPHMPGRWLKSLCAFLSYIDGSLELDTFFLPLTQRHRDVYIMDTVLRVGTFSASEIPQINHCRM
jgi:hypothetical protein